MDAIQAAYGVYDGIVINPAAYTHTSVAILDALKAVAIPAVEVHISDVDSREPFRQISYAGMACVKTYKGLGFQGLCGSREVPERLSEQISSLCIYRAARPWKCLAYPAPLCYTIYNFCNESSFGEDAS